MSSAIEVLKSKKSNCDLCKYDNGKSCDASGGEFGECKPADDFYKAIQEAIVALEKQEKLKKWLDDTERLAKQSNKYYLDKNGVNIFGRQDYYSARIKTIKEIRKILERVGEQK